MSINFTDCQVFINNTGVLAKSISISNQNGLDPVYANGKIGVANIIPAGPVTRTFDIRYVIQTDRDPCFGIASGMKALTDDSSYDPIVLEVAGFTGFGYLTNYSTNIGVNNAIVANVNFTSFDNLSGSLQEQPYSGDFGNDNFIAHGWATYINDGSGYSKSPVYSIQYNFNADWKPKYGLNKVIPHNVRLMGGEETLSMEKEDFYDVQYSGQDFCDIFDCSNPNGLNIGSVNVICGSSDFENQSNPTTGSFLHVPLSGFKVNSSDINVAEGDIIRSRIFLINFF